MNDIVTVQGGPIEYVNAIPSNPITAARQHIRDAIDAIEAEREKPGSNHLDLSNIIGDLQRIEGAADGFAWAHPMSLRRLEKEAKP